MTSTEVRESFLRFFEQRGHRIVPSAQVIPHGDPTLLFTNAGMNQFKDVFLGAGKREYVRAADTQKCIRVSGKHNDLEEVGRDTYHHTFFEMLGNWSFGDYYKKEAIEWAWELLTKVWGLDKKRLYATVFETDTEAADLWKKVTDIDPTHVLPFGKKDNFWEMGETGPCGPCSEIHIDLTPDLSGGHLVNAGDARVMEIWNLVFIQNNRNERGELESLPAKHVDTGMGFERVCAVLQGKSSNYDTDVFMPIISRIAETVGTPYTSKLDSPTDIAMRVIADHIRMLTFSITDGAIPGNEGRGYVLRRILRRAARFGRNLGMREPFIYKITSAVVDSMGKAFPEIVARRPHVEQVIRSEEESFNATLDRGLNEFDSIVANAIHSNLKLTHQDIFYKLNATTVEFFGLPLQKVQEVKISENIEKQIGKSLTISGTEAFKLYDTYGFPLDLTQMLAEERGLKVDVEKFYKLMEEQRERSRTGSSWVVNGNNMTELGQGLEDLAKSVKTIFTGYNPNTLDIEATLLKTITLADIASHQDKDLYFLVDKSPFYVQSGGQVSDTGWLTIEGNRFQILDAKRINQAILHMTEAQTLDGKVIQFGLNTPIAVQVTVDIHRRHNIERNHSATHLVHEALRRVLGPHVQQAGSLVNDEHLRFDFPHFSKITPEEMKAIEEMVNAKIAEDVVVNALNDPKEWVSIEEAKRRYPNIKMFFGEKYGDRVRIVEIDPRFSVELCGGTHVKNTKDIGLFKIVSESSIASGVRRIEAVTGEGVQHYIDKQLEKAKHIDDQLAKLIEEKEMFERELNRYTGKTASSPRPNLGAISLSSSQAESIKVLEATLVEREQAVEHVSKQTTDLKKELSKYKVKEASSGIDSLIAMATPVNGFKVVSSKIEASTMDELKNIGDTLRSKLGSGVGVLASIIDEKVALVCVVTDDLIKQRNLQAGKIVGEMAKQVGGGGGGKPHLATAGGKDVAKLDEALHNASAIVQTMLSK